jgi:hypothetical protein
LLKEHGCGRYAFYWVPLMIGFFARWFKTPQIVVDDAADLIARYGNAAYHEARNRARLARLGHGDRPDEHWGRVAKEIARCQRIEVGLDTATRYVGEQ